VTAELPHILESEVLSRLPPAPTTTFSPLITQELERKRREAETSVKEPLSAIDLSRYEAQEPLADPDSPTSTSTTTLESRAKLRDALRKAYTSYSYLSARQDRLDLLEKHGKNAWLLGNYYLEAELKTLEAELAEAKRQIDILTVARRRQQDEVAAEMKGLEETWRAGVGKVLEAEIAAEQLRAQVLEQLRLRGESGSAG
jgi:pre-mRNA-splicing factor SPF27